MKPLNATKSLYMILNIISCVTIILFGSITADECKCNNFQCEPPVLKSECESNKGMFVESDEMPNTRQICICCDYCVYARKKDESCKPDSNPSNIIICEKNLLCEEISKKCLVKKQSIDTKSLLFDRLNPLNLALPFNSAKDKSDNGFGALPAKSFKALLGFVMRHMTDHEKLAKIFLELFNKFKDNEFFKNVKFYFSKLNPQKMIIVIKALLLLPLKKLELFEFDKLLGNLQVTKLDSLLKLFTQNGLNNMKQVSDPKCKPSFDIDYAVIGDVVNNGIRFEVQQGSSIRGNVEIYKNSILIQDPDFEIINTFYKGKYIKRIQKKQNLCKTEKTEKERWTDGLPYTVIPK